MNETTDIVLQCSSLCNAKFWFIRSPI